LRDLVFQEPFEYEELKIILKDLVFEINGSLNQNLVSCRRAVLMLRNPEDVDDSDIEAVMEGEDTISRLSGKVA